MCLEVLSGSESTSNTTLPALLDKSVRRRRRTLALGYESASEAGQTARSVTDAIIGALAQLDANASDNKKRELWRARENVDRKHLLRLPM